MIAVAIAVLTAMVVGAFVPADDTDPKCSPACTSRGGVQSHLYSGGVDATIDGQPVRHIKAGKE